MECAADAESRVKVLLLDALTQSGLQLTSVRSVGVTTPGEIGLRAELSAPLRHDELLENAVRALTVDPDVRSVRWTILNEAGVRWG